MIMKSAFILMPSTHSASIPIKPYALNPTPQSRTATRDHLHSTTMIQMGKVSPRVESSRVQDDSQAWRQAPAGPCFPFSCSTQCGSLNTTCLNSLAIFPSIYFSELQD